jgi:hypothetical protein
VKGGKDHRENLLPDAEVETEHNGSHRREKGPNTKSPLVPQDCPFVLGMDSRPINFIALHL